VPWRKGHAAITYYVQLPDEYDPHLKYPAIVTLGGAGRTPQQQIDWWSGPYNDQAKSRLGQAARRGYLVIAPAWKKPHQRKYEYSTREHAAVLFSVRDACRRFSIDTDRVFLSGHSMGGDAVWDMGLAHPDLWAGVVPIVATADKYVSRYWENAKTVPFYFVSGEKDGDKLVRNKQDLDRYLKRTGFDVVLVEYLGRGHEHFSDEIQRIFKWMQLQKRDFLPREFECVTMRPLDNHFWWLELQKMPKRALVDPVFWDEKKGVRPVTVEGIVRPSNRLSISTGAGQVNVYLTPEIVKFDERVTITVNSKSKTSVIQPSARVMLEDVRTRGDRIHPFWGKVEVDTGRGP